MWQIFTKLFTALPSLFDSIKGFRGDRASADDLKNSFEKIKNTAPRPWESSTVTAGMHGASVNFPQHEQETQKAEEAMSDAHDKASESALKLVTSFGTLGVGIAAFGLGVKMITNSADVSAHELMMWDAGLAKNVGLLERDRILRQRNLAQATSASAQEFTQAENRAEQATAPIRQSFQRILYKLGTFFSNVEERFGSFFGPDKQNPQNVVDPWDPKQPKGAAGFGKGFGAALGTAFRGMIGVGGDEAPEPEKKDTDNLLRSAIRGDAKNYVPGPTPPPPAPPPGAPPDKPIDPKAAAADVRDIRVRLAMRQRPPMEPVA